MYRTRRANSESGRSEMWAQIEPTWLCITMPVHFAKMQLANTQLANRQFANRQLAKLQFANLTIRQKLNLLIVQFDNRTIRY
jgi:hypothetical protein